MHNFAVVEYRLRAYRIMILLSHVTWPGYRYRACRRDLHAHVPHRGSGTPGGGITMFTAGVK